MFGVAMVKPSGIVTLTTDFSTADGYAGAMKGRILSVFPRAVVVDLSHDIPAGDVGSAAWCLRVSTRPFPRGTVHVAVVDPGVGSGRRPLLLEGGNGQVYVGPDNGIFDLATAEHAVSSAWAIDGAAVSGGSPVSGTFHGRDIFAPAAALAAKGTAPSKFAARVAPESLVRLDHDPHCRLLEDRIVAVVLHVDIFGNIVTSIPSRYGVVIYKGQAGKKTVQKPVRCYTDMREGELHFIEGSSGLMEISLRGDSAAIRTGATRGSEVIAFLKGNR
jgi:S-adenosylmethionine hydrolase